MKLRRISPFLVLSVRLALAALATAGVSGCATPDRGHSRGVGSGGDRPVDIDMAASPSGVAVCYGPFRAGQGPTGLQPSREELLEDLRIIEAHWNTVRTYAAVGTTETVLELIRAHDLDIRVVVGVWIATEVVRDADGVVIEDRAHARRANELEVQTGIRLANTYPDIVAAVAVGNETQVSWTAHRVETTTLIDYIRAVRGAVTAPVTTADDFGFWTLPESRAVADEVDFIITHAYAMWNGKLLGEAIAFTDEKVRAVRKAHPDKLVVLGETGWATTVHTEGEQARLIKGQPGEEEQAEFYDALRRWAQREGTIVFVFEAFDEPWKGGTHPNEVEKHWGLFNVDRTPKRAMR
jgi:exo-beta-1,3-glucanase (GH17 family)